MPPDLELAMMGVKTLAELIGDGTAKVEGNAAILEQLAATLVDFDPLFPIMPGTQRRDAETTPKADVFQVEFGGPPEE